MRIFTKSVLSVALIATCFLFSNSLSAQYEDQGIKFTKGKFKKVLKKARKAGKPVFLDAMAEWCTPCKIMDESTFLDYHLGNLYNENFVSYKLDIDSKHGKKYKEKNNISFVPTFYYIDSKGQIRIEATGSQTVEDLMNHANAFLADYK